MCFIEPILSLLKTILFCKHIDFNDSILIEVYLITLLCSHTHCVLMNRYTLITIGLRVGICFSRSVFYQIWMIRFRKCLLCIYCHFNYNIRVNIVTCPHIWTVTGIKQKFNALGDTYITLSLHPYGPYSLCIVYAFIDNNYKKPPRTNSSFLFNQCKWTLVCKCLMIIKLSVKWFII